MPLNKKKIQTKQGAIWPAGSQQDEPCNRRAIVTTHNAYIYIYIYSCVNIFVFACYHSFCLSNCPSVSLSLSLSLYIYIYIYIDRKRIYKTVNKYLSPHSHSHNPHSFSLYYIKIPCIFTIIYLSANLVCEAIKKFKADQI